jgi:hypothetical protein
MSTARRGIIALSGNLSRDMFAQGVEDTDGEEGIRHDAWRTPRMIMKEEGRISYGSFSSVWHAEEHRLSRAAKA